MDSVLRDTRLLRSIEHAIESLYGAFIAMCFSDEGLTSDGSNELLRNFKMLVTADIDRYISTVLRCVGIGIEYLIREGELKIDDRLPYSEDSGPPTNTLDAISDKRLRRSIENAFYSLLSSIVARGSRDGRLIRKEISELLEDFKRNVVADIDRYIDVALQCVLNDIERVRQIEQSDEEYRRSHLAPITEESSGDD